MRANILFLRRSKEDAFIEEVRQKEGNKLDFGPVLRILRKRRNMKLQTLSNLTNIDVATLSRMENNKMVGTLQSYINIGKVLGLKLSELFKEVEVYHGETFKN